MILLQDLVQDCLEARPLTVALKPLGLYLCGRGFATAAVARQFAPSTSEELKAER
jgi:hypothetical protein